MVFLNVASCDVRTRDREQEGASLALFARSGCWYCALMWLTGVVVMTGAFVMSCHSQASTIHNIYGGYDARQFSSNPIATDLNGGKVGYQFRRADSGVAGFIEGAHLSSDALGLTSLGVGGRVGRVFIRDRVEVGVLGFLEFQSASYERHQNSNQLFALGVGGYLEVRVLPRASLTLTLSAHGFTDITAPTTCNDGSTSQSTGQGTCSSHDGVAFSNDILGDGSGLDAVVGLSFSFGGPPRSAPIQRTGETEATQIAAPADVDSPEFAIISELSDIQGRAFQDTAGTWHLSLSNNSETPVTINWEQSFLEIDGSPVVRIRPTDPSAAAPVQSLGKLLSPFWVEGYDLATLKPGTTHIRLDVHAVPVSTD